MSDRHGSYLAGRLLIAAVVTNKGDAEIITGRGIRSIKRQNIAKHPGVERSGTKWNLTNREISKLQSRCKKGSRRWKKLNAARRRLNGRSERRVKDARHKATREVINFCVDKGVQTLFIGNPHGVRKKPKGRKFNQKLSQWEYGKDKQYLMEKAEKAGMMSTPLRSGRLRAASRGASATPAPRARHAVVAGARDKQTTAIFDCVSVAWFRHQAGAGYVRKRPADAGFPDIATSWALSTCTRSHSANACRSRTRVAQRIYRRRSFAGLNDRHGSLFAPRWYAHVRRSSAYATRNGFTETCIPRR